MRNSTLFVYLEMEIGLIEGIRMRPGMYIGDLGWTGFLHVIEYFFDELIECKNDNTIIQLECNVENRVKLEIKNFNYNRLENKLHNFYESGKVKKSFGIPILIALCEDLQVTIEKPSSIVTLDCKKGEFVISSSSVHSNEQVAKFHFKIDPTIFKEVAINYNYLNLSLQSFAYLNPGLKIISIDKSTEEYQRHVFKYTNGLSDYLDNILSSITYPYPSCRIDLKEQSNGYDYQVSLCYLTERGTWIKSYANNEDTPLHGSLIEGVLEGLVNGVNEVAKKEGLYVKINKNKAKKNIFLIAAVKGDGFFSFSGSVKWTLDMPDVQAAISNLICNEVMLSADATKEELLRHFNARKKRSKPATKRLSKT